MSANTISQLWRYPVKSMGGQRVESVAVDRRAAHGDRLWAVRDLELGAFTTARRLPMLLGCSARFVVEPPADAGPGHAANVVVTFPDGTEITTLDRGSIDSALTALCGKRVALEPLPPVTDKAAYRAPMATKRDIRRQFAIDDDGELPDLSMLPLSKLTELARYATPIGTFADIYPLHILTTATLQALQVDDVRRLRPNILIDTPGIARLAEQEWIGGTLRTADSVLRIDVPTIRCSIPMRAQPQFGLLPNPELLRRISSQAKRCLGVYAEVDHPGVLRVGEKVHYTPAPTSALGSTVTRLADRIKRNAVHAGNRLLPEG